MGLWGFIDPSAHSLRLFGMKSTDPYSPPSMQFESQQIPQQSQGTGRAWFRCWIGIGVGGTVTGFFLRGVWGLLILGLRGFVAGLISSAMVFAASAFVCGGSLSRRVSNLASIASGVGAGLLLFGHQAFVLPTVIITVGLVLGGVSPELIFWDRRDHSRVLRLAERFRGISDTFRMEITDSDVVDEGEE
ncbi:MAG: hypothetical protein R3C49_10190 [Planctomycetaceae bacterium]